MGSSARLIATAWGGEVLAVGVLSKFAAHDLIQVHDPDRNLAPAELLGRAQPALTRDQLPVWLDDDRVQQAEFGNAVS